MSKVLWQMKWSWYTKLYAVVLRRRVVSCQFRLRVGCLLSVNLCKVCVANMGLNLPGMQAEYSFPSNSMQFFLDTKHAHDSSEKLSKSKSGPMIVAWIFSTNSLRCATMIPQFSLLGHAWNPIYFVQFFIHWKKETILHTQTKSPNHEIVRARNYDQGEPAVSHRWTGWVWETTGWGSRLQENYRSF